MTLIRFVIAILATYRLARLLPEDEGPFFIFTRIRSYVFTQYGNEAALSNKEELTCLNKLQLNLRFWESINSGMNCPYCCGLYAAILTAILSKKRSKIGDLFLLIFAVAGGQSLIQKLGGE
jgi:hypothetical protein